MRSSLALVLWERRHLYRAVHALAPGRLVLWVLEVVCCVTVGRCANFDDEHKLKKHKIVQGFQIFFH